MTEIPEATMTTSGDDSVAKIDERDPAPSSVGQGAPAVPHAGLPQTRAALVLSTFASGVWVVAIVWEVIRIGGGPAQLSIVSTASAVGVLLPALLAGVLADRIPQKTILLCVAAVEFGGMLLVAFLSLSDLTQIWHLAAVTFVTGMGMAFYYSAYSAWLPALVPESDLMAVNGFEGMVRPTIGQAAGPALAGFLVGALSSGAASRSPPRSPAPGSSPCRWCPRPLSAVSSTRMPPPTRSRRHWRTCARVSSTWSGPRGCSPPCSSHP